MFTRSLSVLAGMLVVSGTLAATSALATDEPAPPPKGTPKVACVDNMRPLSRLSVGWQGGFRKGSLRGVAIDQGCGTNGAGKVKTVSVAIARKVGNRCQHLMSNGKLGPATACKHVWLPAKGAKAWTFHVRHALPRGKYIVSTRAIDAAGNIEARANR
jgi:hypothetical protein